MDEETAPLLFKAEAANYLLMDKWKRALKETNSSARLEADWLKASSAIKAGWLH